MVNSLAEAGNERDDGWLKPRWFALLLALLTLTAYPQILFGSQSFVYRDFGFFAYPIAFHWRESFWHGEIPLWNPLSNCGMPFLAEWNTQVLYPPALFYLLFPLSWSLSTFCVLHLFLGGLGMFYLARAWTNHPFAAAFAGLVFAFNGLMLNSLMWPAFVPGLAWMPWVVWLTERAWREGGRTMILAALAGSLQMLSGAAEAVLLTWVLLGALALRDLVRGELPRKKLVWRAVAVVLLISGLSAAQLFPFLDLLHNSHRQGWAGSTQWPMPKTGWLNFLVPLLHCGLQQGVFVQNNQYWTSSYYVGVSTVALGLAGLWRRNSRAWLLAALAVFCLILALGDGTPVYPWLCQHFHFLGLMRYPIKFVILPVFVLPLLAAGGLAKKPEHPGATPSKRDWSGGLIWLSLTFVILGILWLNRPQSASDPNDTAALISGLIRILFFTAILGGLFLAGKIADRKQRSALQLFLLVLVWFDLFQQEPQPQTVNRSVYAENLPRALAAPQFGGSRVVVPDTVRDRLVKSYFPDATQDFVSHRLALFLNCNLLDDVPKCDAFFPLYLSHYANVYAWGFSDPLLDFMGVSQVVGIESESLAWQPRKSFMPLLTGGQVPVFTNELGTLSAVVSTNFAPRRTVYLPLEARNHIMTTNPALVTILAANYSAQKIGAKVSADGPAMMVIAQTYYHPWRAYVDDQPTALWRANYTFQALEVPAGVHEVKLVYEDYLFYLGAFLSLTTLAGCLVALCLNRRFNADASPEIGR